MKLPLASTWHNLLYGLLNNLHEAAWSRSSDHACPVLARFPGGWLNLVPRCRPLTPEEFAVFDFENFCKQSGLRVESKPDSFGWLGDRIVALDFGW